MGGKAICFGIIQSDHLYFQQYFLCTIELLRFNVLFNVAGIYTGSIYQDILIQSDDFRGARVTNTSVIVIKTHICSKFLHQQANFNLYDILHNHFRAAF